jgi:hypothetical protein
VEILAPTGTCNSYPSVLQPVASHYRRYRQTPRKLSVRIVDIPAEIRTKHLLNTNLNITTIPASPVGHNQILLVPFGVVLPITHFIVFYYGVQEVKH